MHRKLLASLTIPLLTVCASCGKNLRVEIVKPPVALTRCADEPEPPDLAAVDWSDVPTARAQQLVRDQMVFAYVLALRSAWGDCSATVAGVKAWSDGLGK